MNQYKQTEGSVPVTKPQQVSTRTPVDIKIAQLEEQIADQQQQIMKLNRTIGRLKNEIGDIITVVKNRG